ncbi:MAG: sodium:solute symporter [Planctomycetes bacterium]|nr:sodium:solute symporter [Planctomycetota bacterium]
MHPVDIGIIGVYLLGAIGIGIYASRKASKGIQQYFLGGRTLPWWALGASGMASNLDLTGTMIIISFFTIIGVKGFLVELRGGVVLVMAFLLAFMGKWNRRSLAMTSAEWMEFRFGDGVEGAIARVFGAISQIVLLVGMIAYFSVGTGKFLAVFLGLSPQLCMLIMATIALLYTAIGGFYGVVYTDLFQGFIVLAATIYVTLLAFFTIDASFIAENAPAGWTNILPSWHMEMPKGYEIYDLFFVASTFYFIRVVLEGFAGPNTYMAQRYLAAKSDRECGLLSAWWTALMAFRWPFIMAVAVLGLKIKAEIGADPERTLPEVIRNLLPVGFKGTIIAALLAAEMSTFDSTINAGASYIVRDIYQRFIHPRASEKRLMVLSYASTVLITAIGVGAAFFIRNINDIWGWITMALGAGIVAPHIARWFWWRFNGYGYAAGIGVGIASAIVYKIVCRVQGIEVPEYTSFLLLMSLSVAAMVVVSLLTKPTPAPVLSRFYRRTRPFGAWGAVASELPDARRRAIRRENSWDLVALCLAIPWQICLFLVPIQFVLHDWGLFFALLSVLAALSVGLYFAWYRRLDGEPGAAEPETAD